MEEIEEDIYTFETPIYAVERTRTRERTPVQQALDELSKQLQQKFEVGDDLRREFLYEMQDLDTITTMNMGLLAAVLVYIRDVGNVTTENFTDEKLLPYIRILMQKYKTPSKGSKSPTSTEIKDVEAKYKLSFLRYILKINSYRNTGGEEVEVETLLT